MPDILYVIGSLDVGGAESHLFQISPKLLQKGWDIEVFCIGHRGVLADKLEEQGIKVNTPFFESKNNPNIFYRVFRIIYAFIALFIFMLINRPKIVHCFLPKAYLMGGLCAVLTVTPFKLMSRRSLNTYQQKHGILTKLEKKLHGFMDVILGNSKAVMTQLGEEGVVPAKLRLLYNGVDEAKFINTDDRIQTRKALGVSESTLVFVIVANLIPYKGHVTLIEALAKIKERLPNPWTIWIVGRDDGIGEGLKKQVEALGLTSFVQWIGASKEVPALLKAADIGVLSSYEEGFSNAILEGMAAGLPMVVTDVGGNAEAVLNEVTGLVVPPKDAISLSEALLKLALDEVLRIQYANAGIYRVKSNFSLEACVLSYDTVYKELQSF